MATVNLSFDVPAAHVTPLRSYVDFLHGNAVSGMTDEQALEYHVVQSTVPGYKAWRRAYDSAVTTAKATLQTNGASRAAALATDQASLATAQAAAESAGNSAMAGLT